MQNILGLSPLEAGLRYLPITIASFLMAPLAGAAMAKVPARVLMSIGLALTGTGLLLMSGVGEGDTWTTLLGGFLVAGGGIGIVNPVLANVALSTVPDEQSGVASGINDTFRQVGVAVGVAGLGAVFLARVQDHIAGLLPGTTSEQARGLAEAVSSGGLSGAPEAVAAAARDGFLTGFNEILLIGAAIAFAGSVLVLLLVRTSHIRTHEAPVEGFEPLPEPIAA
jgi:hypothetical protein